MTGRSRFGLVLIEALACGTPVLAYRRGSIPEIIEDGVTGFVCEGLDEMTAAVQRIPEIDRGRCRSTFEQRFTVERMAHDYVRVYERVLGKTCHKGSREREFRLLAYIAHIIDQCVSVNRAWVAGWIEAGFLQLQKEVRMKFLKLPSLAIAIVTYRPHSGWGISARSSVAFRIFAFENCDRRGIQG